jgi:protein-S-isoprenylcysteine O-methyltransferase Ste14
MDVARLAAVSTGPWELAFAMLAILSHGGLLAGTLWTLCRPAHRLWPPPGRDSWQFRLVWSLFAVATFSFICLGVVDWNSLSLPLELRLSLGGLLLLGGLGLAFWGITSLGLEQSLGLKGEMVPHGPYRFTRNPQYLGDLAATIGWMLLTGSVLVIVAGVPSVMWYLMLPRTEEPWLEDRYGDAYRRYSERLPRFLGRRHEVVPEPQREHAEPPPGPPEGTNK